MDFANIQRLGLPVRVKVEFALMCLITPAATQIIFWQGVVPEVVTPTHI